MLTMLDKGINSIQYNYLNLPNSLHLNKNGNEDVTINTKYRADGTKLSKENITTITGFNGFTTTKRFTDYLDGFQYVKTENSGSGGGSETLMTSSMSARAMQPEAYSIVTDPTVQPVGGSFTASLKTPDLQYLPTAEGFYDYQKEQYIYQYKDHLGNVRVSYGRNSAGALEITDANDYYPFGMNHLKTGNAFFGRGSYKDNKYNGKELQETGMYSYGWRDYMPDIARWNGIDQLAEAYTSTSPFAYVANNPVLMTDPDGRWMDDTGHITDTTGQTFGFLGSSYKPQGATNYLGVKYGDGGGNGSYTPFGRTQAYADLMTAFYNGGTGGMSNIGGTLRWWTDYEDPNTEVKGIGILEMLKLKPSYKYDSDMHKTSQTLRTWSGYAFSANKFVFQPAADRAVLYGAGEAYSTTNLVFEKALPKILGSRRIYVPLMEVSVKNAQRLAVGTRVAGTALGIAGIALAGNDIKNNGVTTSNSLDLVMSVLAVSPTGWGQAIAGTYFLANGITTLVTGKDIGQHIEGAVNKYYNDGVRAEEQRKFNAAMGY
jgi:RHS repeat-associated protein